MCVFAGTTYGTHPTVYVLPGLWYVPPDPDFGSILVSLSVLLDPLITILGSTIVTIASWSAAVPLLTTLSVYTHFSAGDCPTLITSVPLIFV